MNFIKKLFGNEDESAAVDYYREGLDLLRTGRYHEALTSFRLALRERPRDVAVLQQIAITYTRIGMTDEAVKTYRAVLDQDPQAVGAHYGLAFLHLTEGRSGEAVDHLRRFLESPPAEAEAVQHVDHARATLARLEEDATETPT
jgi:cytochrome c-type biogenesis protein CcmH/NrfG